MIAALLLLAVPGQVSPSSRPREPTDVFIRRKAGLPADTAKGAIAIIDVGHLPLSTMVSIVGNRHGAMWHASYACAESPRCAPNADHRAVDYDLSPADSAAVDAILDELRTGSDPGGQRPSSDFIGGYLTVVIDDRGFRQDYRRSGLWGPILGRLETLMTAPARLPPR